MAQRQHNFFIQLEPKRGTIYDRNGKPMALNVAAYSLYAQPKTMRHQDKEEVIESLPEVLDVSGTYLRERLDRDKYFIWLKRKLNPQKAKEIEHLKLRGLGFRKESKRYYPNKSLAAHVIGFAGLENEGLEGLEKQYNSYLKGNAGFTRILKDARHRELMIEKDFLPPKDGMDLVLTIDETIQYLAERALDEAFEQHNAKGAALVMIAPKTGEILAMASRPTYDLEDVRNSEADVRRNRAIHDMYEPGSVFKIVAMAAALEEGKFTEEDTFYCEQGSYRVGPHILHDHRPHGTLTFSEVFEQSSNIGVTKIAQALGSDVVYKYARFFRFGQQTGIDLLGEVEGVVKPPSRWSRVSIAAVPIGHEVTVTALQLVCAVASVANDGLSMKPFVVKYIQDQRGEVIRTYEPRERGRVISRATALRMKKILQRVVKQGTGRRAAIDDIPVAGKTGTAQKVVDGVYSHSKFYATFIGFAPVEDPQIAMVVLFDEPHPDHFGGTVAAPVFRKVAGDVIRYLDTLPEEAYASEGPH